MARYIKANPKVAAYLGLEKDRNTVKDGNYLLWQGDMLKFGPLTQLAETLEMIGGIALLPHEAREEQDGTVTRPLPVATDPRFIVETAATSDDNNTQVEDTATEAESPVEATETATTEESGENGGADAEENPENN